MSMIRLMLIAAVCAAHSFAQADEQAAATERLRFMTSAAESFVFSAEGSAEGFQLKPEPLLRWNNPISGTTDGGLFLWTDGGRPAAAVKFYQKQDGTWLHNLQSLAIRPFTADRGKQLVWNPRTPGVTFQPVPDAPPPAVAPAQRKLQLRRLARGFQLKEQYQEDEAWQLRQLATPLLQYEAASEGVLDGGLFAFVVGTNPEVVLLIEAHDRSSDAERQSVWMYAFAPLTGYAVTAHHNGGEVWSAERRKLRRPITEPYTSDYFESRGN